jgi:acyl-coenzyme A synthetase/AMP-(fatty) acid ligase
MRSIDQIAFISRIAPERYAVIAGTSIVTFGMLEQATQQVMARVVEFGLPAGSLVGMSIKAPARHLAVTLALARLGLVSAPISSDQVLAVLPELDLVLADEPRTLSNGRLCLVVDDNWFSGSLPAPPSVPCADADLFRIVTSSGTTGTPKPLHVTYGTFEFQSQAPKLSSVMAGTWSRILMMMDLGASWALMLGMTALAEGRTLCFAANPDEAVRVMSLYKVDVLFGAVFHLNLILEAQRRRFIALPSLTAIITGGSLMDADLLGEVQGKLCRNILMHYGSTEIGLTAVARPSEADVEGGELGFILPWNEVEVVGEDRRPLPDGEVGEFRIRAEGQVVNLPREAGEDGLPWFYPGDVGYRSAEGKLFLTGRSSDLINIGGGKIAPERIERMLKRHPKVKDAGVCGFGTGLERIRAAVVVGEGFDLADLEAHCAREFKVAPIERIVVVEAISRGMTGKIERKVLRESLS